MKIKQLIAIFLILFIFQNTFASYTNSDTLRTIILFKKNNKTKIDVGDKIFIVKENEKGRIRGEVTNITENSLEINNEEYHFSEIKTIGAKRKLKKIKFLYISLISLGSSLFISGSAYSTAYISSFHYDILLVAFLFFYIGILFFILSLICAFLILVFLLVYGLLFFIKKRQNLKKWKLKVIDKDETKLYY